MKNQILIIILLFSFNTGYINALYENINEVSEVRPKENKTYKEKVKIKNNFSKKDLKKEIKRRKRYHKTLLSLYKRNFDEKVLNELAYNSNRLSYLRKFNNKI